MMRVLWHQRARSALISEFFAQKIDHDPLELDSTKKRSYCRGLLLPRRRYPTMPLQQLDHHHRRHHQMSTNGEHSYMTEQRHKQRTPPEWAAASSWSDHADAEEEEQNASFLEMPHHQQSNDYYDEINEEDIIISDENGEYNYGMQEMKDYTHHDNGLADENNDEVASMHTNGHYE
eukprot:scaffold33706_cov227-Skeletonema_dohrnii-CCMP3373.AAC.4